jgi:hypothetical protein
MWMNDKEEARDVNQQLVRASPPQNCKQFLYVKNRIVFNDHCPHPQTS